MLDKWTVKSPSGVVITFKIKGSPESGFEHSAKAEQRDSVIVRRWAVLSRPDVEKLFAEYIRKS